MAGVRTYDPKLVSVVWGGVVLTGFSEGTIVECEKNEESATHHVGALGEVTQVINSDDTGIISISLSSNSPSLILLANDAQSNVIKPISVVDMNDDSVNVGGSQAWVHKTPDLSIGKEIEDVEIEILVADYQVG